MFWWKSSLISIFNPFITSVAFPFQWFWDDGGTSGRGPELQWISTLQRSIPMEKMAALGGLTLWYYATQIPLLPKAQWCVYTGTCKVQAPSAIPPSPTWGTLSPLPPPPLITAADPKAGLERWEGGPFDWSLASQTWRRCQRRLENIVSAVKLSKYQAWVPSVVSYSNQ